MFSDKFLEKLIPAKRKFNGLDITISINLSWGELKMNYTIQTEDFEFTTSKKDEILNALECFENYDSYKEYLKQIKRESPSYLKANNKMRYFDNMT